MAGAELHLTNKELPPDIVGDVQRLWAAGGQADFARLMGLYGLFPLYRGHSAFEVDGRVFVRLHRPPLLEPMVSSTGLGARATVLHLLRPLDAVVIEAGVVPRAKGLNIALNAFRTRLEYAFSVRSLQLAPRGRLTLFNHNSFRMREWEILARSYRKGLRWRPHSWPVLSVYHKESHKDLCRKDGADAPAHPQSLVFRIAGPFPIPWLFSTLDAKVKVDFLGQTTARCTFAGASLWQGSWPLINYLRLQRTAVMSSRSDILPRRVKSLYVFEEEDKRVWAAMGSLAELGWRIQGSRPVSFFGFCSGTWRSDGRLTGAWGAGLRVEAATSLSIEVLMRARPTLYGLHPFVLKFNFSD